MINIIIIIISCIISVILIEGQLKKLHYVNKLLLLFPNDADDDANGDGDAVINMINLHQN